MERCPTLEAEAHSLEMQKSLTCSGLLVQLDTAKAIKFFITGFGLLAMLDDNLDRFPSLGFLLDLNFFISLAPEEVCSVFVERVANLSYCEPNVADVQVWIRPATD